MATITRSTKTGGGTNLNTGQLAVVADINTDMNTIVTEINGLLDDGNIETATIPGAKSLRFTEITAPATPGANDLILYAPTTAGTTLLNSKDSGGTVLVYGGVIDRDVTTNTVTNTVTETSVYSFSVPGNTLSTNRMLRLTLRGNYLNNSGVNRALTVRVKYGATTIGTFDDFSAITTAANRHQVFLDYRLIGFNATNAQHGTGLLHFSGTGGSSVAGQDFQAKTDVATEAIGLTTHRTIAEDSTGALTLDVTVEHSAAALTIEFVTDVAILELV